MTDSRTDPQYKLRMPATLYDSIVSAAKVNNRSMNAEIISRLQSTFALPDDIESAPSISQDLETLQHALLRAMIAVREGGKSIRISLTAEDEHGNSEPIIPKMPEDSDLKEMQKRIDARRERQALTAPSTPTPGTTEGRSPHVIRKVRRKLRL